MVSKHGQELQEAFNDIDQLLATDRYSLLGNWLESAKSWGDNEAAKVNLEFNARNQITLWGPNGQIEDYANKNWAGLMKTYYSQRWVLFVDELLSCLDAGKDYDDKAFRKKLFDSEMEWNHDTTPFPTEPEGDIVELSKAVLKKYTRYYSSNAIVCDRVWAEGVKKGEHLSKIGFLGSIKEQKDKRRQMRRH